MIKKFLKCLLCFSMVVTMFSTLKKGVNAADENLIKVTVLYQFENGKEAYEANVSTVIKGESYPLQIIFPKISGYKSTFKTGDNTYEDKLKLEIDTATLTEDVTYIVYYLPIDVKYQIRYYKQNIYDDGYTEDASLYVMDEGKTGDQPKSEYFEKEITGFTKLYHQPDEIAADGSTIFEIYYDRNYYMISFDLAGGYGTVPVYERYGTNVVVNEPTKTGYDFVGWELIKDSVKVDIDYTNDDNSINTEKKAEHDAYKKNITDNYDDTLPSTVPYASMKYKAIWTPKKIGPDYNNKYTVIYWKWNPNPIKDENGNDIYEYDYWGNYEVDGVVAGYEVTSVRTPEQVGLSQYKFYESNYEKIEGLNQPIEGDGTSVINVYYKPKKYTFKFFYARSPINDDSIIEVGGNTTEFARDYSTNYKDNNGKTRLNLMLTYKDVHWGTVEKEPIVNDDKGYYQFGKDEIGNYNYSYFTFDAYFGELIREKWPVGNIPPVKNDGKQRYGDDATFSAWNSEFYSKYARNSNKTVKGRYSYVDEGILYDTEYGTTDLSQYYYNNTIHFLGFYENAVTTVSWNEPIKINYYMYIPDENISPSDVKYREYQGVKYRKEDETLVYDNNVDSTGVNGEQTYTAFDGYKFVKREVPDNEKVWTNGKVTEYNIYFYYEPLSYTLELNNHGTIVKVSQPIEYKESISFFSTPSYPSNLEQDVYEFKGWYTNPGFTERSKVTDDYTMPAHDVMLYAKWEKTKLNVTTFEDVEDHDNNQNGTLYEDVFSHGSGVDEDSIIIPTKEGYTFVGWYFYDPITGIKKRFEYEILPFYHDLKMFAEWTSTEVIPYEILYVIKDTVTELADRTTGKTNAGLTKTFTAKSADQFYPQFNTSGVHYYPETNSHSLLMKHYDGTGVNPNIYSFAYIQKNAVNYKVRYINAETGDVIKTEDYNNVTDYVITKKFTQPVAGKTYIPDAMYKTLILAADDSQNIIEFYCTETVNQAKYVVRHHIETSVVDGVIMYDTVYKTEEFVDKIGNTAHGTPIEIVGYQYVKGDPTEGVVGADGLVIDLYYNKKLFPYEVRHVLEGTDTYMPTDDFGNPSYAKGTAKYGDVLEFDALQYENYQPVAVKQSIEIRVSENDPISNVLIFYYHSKQAVVKYEVVTDDGGIGGQLTSSQTVLDASNVDSNIGSTAIANEYYEFVGWYSDPACTNKLSEPNDKIELNGTSLAPRVIEDATYYARFVRPPGPIKITRTNAIDESQVFVYNVTWKDPDNTEHLITVTIVGNGSVTIQELPFGEYTVTEQNGWSWRYDGVSQTLSHDGPDTHFQFSHGQNADKLQWLNGNSEREHNVREEVN